MKLAEQPGFLDKKLGQRVEPLPDHLSWEAIGDQILPPKKPRRRRWWLLFLFLVVGGLAWFSFPNEKQSSGHSLNDEVIHSFQHKNLYTDKQEEQQNYVTEQSPKIKERTIATLEKGSKSPSNTFAFSTVLTQELSYSHRENDSPKIKEILPIELPLDSLLSSKNKQIAFLPTRPLSQLSYPSNLVAKDFNSLFPENEEETETPLQESDQMNLQSPLKNNRLTLYGQVLGEASLFTGVPQEIVPIMSAQPRVRVGVETTNGWALSINAKLGRYVWRSELNSSNATTLYRPGTIDTIFRNVIDGSERIITTDSIPGIINTQFRGYGRITTLEFPITIGKVWPVSNGRLGLHLGLAPSFVTNKKGQSIVAEEEIVSVAESNLFDRPFFLQLVGEMSYSYPIGQQIAIQANLSVDYGTSPLMRFSNRSYRLTRYTFGVGLRFQL